MVLHRRGPLVAMEIHRHLGNTSLLYSAVNNRLEHLRAMGLVERRAKGREYIYSLRTPPPVGAEP